VLELVLLVCRCCDPTFRVDCFQTDALAPLKLYDRESLRLLLISWFVPPLQSPQMLVDKVLVEFFLGEEELELDLDLLDFAAACRVVDILPS